MEKLLTIENFIDGEFVKHEGTYIDSYDPSTGKVWAKVPEADGGTVEAAVQAANKAFTSWSVTPVKERSAIVMRIADILESKLDEFAEYESRDQGKPVALAKRVDIPRAVLNFRFFATSILHTLNISEHLDDRDAINYTTRHPVGVAGQIAPWNLPLYLLTFKIAPAIAMGNTVVAKPSEMTSVTTWMLCKVFKEAGLPPGVVNIVFGTGPAAGDAIVRHPKTSLISFTGSTATAQHIRASCAPYCKKLSLELGGKNAAIVFADADLEICVPELLRASFTNQGEVCLASSRLFVHEDIFQDFLTKFVAAARAIKVGDPRSMDTTMGALISKEHLAKVKGYIELARTEGATIHCGDGVDRLELSSENAGGYFVQPTVISGVADNSRLMQEEIFGPVICIVPFKDQKEVVERANNCPYGLSATVWTKDLNTAHKMSQHLEVGTVWVNCWMVRSINLPFGGVKASGEGREGLQHSLEFYTEIKTVCIKL